MLAALALSLISFHWLFVGTGLGFAVSVALVLAARIPNAVVGEGAIAERLAAGLRLFVATPDCVATRVEPGGRRRGLGGDGQHRELRPGRAGWQSVRRRAVAGGDGLCTMVIALALPRMDRRATPVMLAGAAVLLVGLAAALALSILPIGEWHWSAAPPPGPPSARAPRADPHPHPLSFVVPLARRTAPPCSRPSSPCPTSPGSSPTRSPAGVATAGSPRWRRGRR